MAFVAGRAAFILGLDKSQLDAGLPAAERQVAASTSKMEKSFDGAGSSASRAAAALGTRGGSGLVGRMGLIGAAAYAGVSALNKVSQALKTTGYDAGTTVGKFRNFAASLLQGDVVDAITSLTHATTLSAKAFEDLQIQLYNMDFSRFNAEATKAAGYTQQLTIPTRVGLRGGSTVTYGANSAVQEQLRLAALAARDLRIRDAESLAARTPGLQDDLDVARRRGQFIRDQLARETPGTPEYAQLNAALSDAVNRRTDLEEKIKGKPAKGIDRDRTAPRSILDRLSRASLTPGLADDLSAASAEETYFKNRLKTAKEGTARYTTILNELARAHAAKQSVVDQIQAIEDAAAAEAERKRLDAERKRERERARRAREAERAAREAASAQQRNIDAVRKALNSRVGPYANTSQGFAGGRPVGSQAYGATTDSSPTDPASDFSKLSFEFLQTLRGVTNQFSSNYVLTHLMRENNQHLSSIAAKHRNPEAFYGRSEIDAAMQGS